MMTEEHAETLARVTELLSSYNPDHVRQGLELVEALDAPWLLDILTEGSTIKSYGSLYSGGWIERNVRSELHPRVTLRLLYLQDKLGEVTYFNPDPELLSGSLRVLDRMPALQYLTVSQAQHISDFASLGQLPLLWSLSLGRASLLDLKPLPSLKRLYSLTMEHCPGLRSLDGLQDQLSRLGLVACPALSDLSALDEYTQLSQLSVTGMQVEQLPPIASMSLQELSLERIGAVAPWLDAVRQSSVASLSIRSQPDLTALPPLPPLTSLKIRDCPLEALGSAAQPQLRLLELRGTSLPPVLPLRRLRGLSSLTLGWHHPTLSLSGLPRLRSLTVGGSAVKSLLVRRMPGLRSLELERRLRLSSLTMSGLGWIRLLNLENCGASAITLSRMPRLRVLNLSTSRGKPRTLRFSRLPGVRSLTIRADEFTCNRNTMRVLSGLRRLSLCHARALECIPALRGYPELTELYIDGCARLSLLSGLSTVPRLTALRLSGAHALQRLHSIGRLRELESLTLERCGGLVSLSGLHKLKRLKRVRLTSCRGLADLSALSGCTALEHVNLRELPALVDVSALAALPSLKTARISDCRWIDRGPLEAAGVTLL